jgi:thiamine pyrophosphate-dependent acetolactate synthase large subunit-like protein
MEYETSQGWAVSAAAVAEPAPELPLADDEAIEAAAAVLANSERPIILAGRGAFVCGARDALVELADRSGALLATTLKGKDLFAGHPCNLGIAGGYSGTLAAKLFGEADAVLAFGASLNAFTTKRRRLFPDATLVQCDVEPEAMVRNGRPAIAVQGDARAVAELLVARLGDSPARDNFRVAAADAGLGPDTWRWEFADCSTEGALDPRAVCARLDELLPIDRTIVTDAGSVGEYPPALMRVPAPDAFLWLVGDFGAVGTGLAPAIGAALGRPDRLTTLFVGDGGLFMAMQELDLAVRDRIPLLVVCLNDRAYGSEFHHMHDDGLPDVVGARFETPDLAALARAMGCDGMRIDRLEQLDTIPSRLTGLDRPLVLDCQLTQELVPSQLRQHLVA